MNYKPMPPWSQQKMKDSKGILPHVHAQKHLPWSERRAYILHQVGKMGEYGYPRPTRDSYLGGHILIDLRDIQRMIDEKDLVVVRTGRGWLSRRRATKLVAKPFAKTEGVSV